MDIYRYEVIANDRLAEDTVLLTLRPLGEPLQFQAGQYVQAGFIADGLTPEKHPFSVLSAPGEEYMQFAIKALGDYTANLLTLPAGSVAELQGPYGLFSYLEAPESQQLWIASGIAIAPFLSMARDLQTGGKKVHLHYFVRSHDSVLGLSILNGVRSKLGAQKFNFTVHAEKYSAAVMQRLLTGMDHAALLACGGPELKKLVTQTATAQGHSGSVLFDDFLAESVAV